MKSTIVLGLFLVLFFMWMGVAPASADQPGWAFLKVGAGAHGAAMGEALTAIIGEPSSSFYNPAGIAGFRGKEWMFSHTEGVQGIRTEAVAFTGGGASRTLAVSVIVYAADGIERRTHASMQPLGNFGVYDMRIDMTYAQQRGRLSIGGTAKLISEKILEESSVGGAIDIGAVYTIHPFLLGGSLRNLGVTGQMLTQSEDLPTDWNIGITYRPSNPPVTVTGTLRARRETDRSGELKVIGGVGLEYRPTERLFLRGGYRPGVEVERGSVGIGIAVKRWMIDYAFVPFDFGLGETHRFTLRFR